MGIDNYLFSGELCEEAKCCIYKERKEMYKDEKDSIASSWRKCLE